MRTRNGYNDQCNRLDQGDHYKKTYGLNKFSVLNTSRYYHVVGGLPPDAMHDILEGVLQYFVKYFRLDDLNRRIVAYLILGIIMIPTKLLQFKPKS